MKNDNPISLNLSENNPMSSLAFHWEALFNDSSVVMQFDQDNKEHLFKEVKDKFDQLQYFILYHTSQNLYFMVNLEKGIIGNNTNQFLETETKDNIRLIYFRRNTVNLNSNLQEINRTIVYFLGFQYIKNGKNEKVLLQIDSQGNWKIGE